MNSRPQLRHETLHIRWEKVVSHSAEIDLQHNRHLVTLDRIASSAKIEEARAFARTALDKPYKQSQ